MEKMLDKKSRDFAKNMRDTMIYDKSKNEVQIGTNLYADGEIKSSPIKRVIDVTTLPLEENYYIFDTAKFNNVTVVDFQEAIPNKYLRIKTGRTFIIIDRYFENNPILDGFSSLAYGNDNYAEINLSTPLPQAGGLIIINLSSVVLIYASHEV